MTLKKNAKSAIIASLFAALVIPIAGIHYASAQSSELNIVRGVVEYTPYAESDLINELVLELNTLKSDDPKSDEIKAEIRNLTNQLESRIKYNLTDQERAEMKAKYELLNDRLDTDADFKRLLETEVVGFGTDESTKGIFITVSPPFANQENYERYFSVFRETLGSETTIAIEVNERGTPTACTSRTSDCDPLRGSIKIESESYSPCSLGFKADLNGAEGFVMAGHCTSNSKKVYQPDEDFFENNRVGVVTQTAWDSDTKCDCAFVDLDTGESINDDVYATVDLDSVGTVSANDSVTMAGYAGGAISTTVKTADYTTTINGNTLRNFIQLNDDGDNGDSGGPVYDAGSDELYATQSHEEGAFAIVSNANYLDDEISGASWDFS